MKNEKVFKKLMELVAIKSVSTDDARYHEILKAVAFLKDWLEEIGCQIKIITHDQAPPMLIGIKKVERAKKTIGIYGHYDVQPEDPVDEWLSPPFQLTAKEGRFYGRGVADNKGHIVQNLDAVDYLIKSNRLTNNIFFIFEGEEETGSLHFEEYINKAKDLLGKVDIFYLTDVGMYQKNKPQIFYALRGLIPFELNVVVGGHDLHSGVYGNKVFNPINVVASLLAKIKDVNSGEILIPGFYKDVKQLAKPELSLLKKTIKPANQEKREAGVFQLTTIRKSPFSLSSKIFPSFDCHGIISGYTGAGVKTVIPRSAKVKFSFRLVEYQKPRDIKELVGNFIEKNLPTGVKYRLTVYKGNPPFYTDINNDSVVNTAKILSAVFQNETIFNRSGGSVPAAEVLQRVFQKPIILTGFTLSDGNIHAPNENFNEEMFWKGIEALKAIYSN